MDNTGQSMQPHPSHLPRAISRPTCWKANVGRTRPVTATQNTGQPYHASHDHPLLPRGNMRHPHDDCRFTRHSLRGARNRCPSRCHSRPQLDGLVVGTTSASANTAIETCATSAARLLKRMLDSNITTSSTERDTGAHLHIKSKGRAS